MSRPRTTRALRWIEVGRAAWGAAMLIHPQYVLDRLSVAPDRRSVAVARVLGARHLAQAALSGVRPSPEVLALGVWVDAVHAASALGLAVLDRDRVRAGLLDAVVAGTWAAAGLRDLSRGAVAADEQLRDVVAQRALRRLPGGHLLLVRARAARTTKSG